MFNGGTKENGRNAEILNSNVPGPVHGKSWFYVHGAIRNECYRR